jgi:hypothetical protein
LKNFVLSICLIALLASCKSNEEETAQKTVDRYMVFVDSVNKLRPEERAARWKE